MTHEHAYADQLIRAAEEHGEVEAITVTIGELAPVTPEELKSALTKRAWRVTIKEEESLVRCRCGREGRARIIERGHHHAVFACPACNERYPEIIKGGEVILTSVRVKERGGRKKRATGKPVERGGGEEGGW